VDVLYSIIGHVALALWLLLDETFSSVSSMYIYRPLPPAWRLVAVIM